MTTIYQVRTKGEKDWLDVNLIQYQACGCSDLYEQRLVCLDITEAHGRLQQENNDLRHGVERLITAAPARSEAVAVVVPVIGAGATDMQGNLGVTVDAPAQTERALTDDAILSCASLIASDLLGQATEEEVRGVAAQINELLGRK